MKLLSLCAGSALALMAGAASATAYVTDPAGSGMPFSNYQPSLVLTQTIALEGIFPPIACCNTSYAYIGMIHSFAGNFGYDDMPKAQGQIYPIQGNTTPFSILGTMYGGDGNTTFGLPDLGGRVAIGAGQGPGLPNFAIGEQVGSANVGLSVANLPSHTHDVAPGVPSSPTGGNTPFDNYQPSLAMSYFISTEGIYPSQDGGSGRTMIGEVALFAGNFAPGNWLAANGQLLSVTDYDTLFSIIGTTYGGDGVDTFALPDLRGRTIIGAGQGPGLANYALGETTGTPTVTLSEAQMPTHDHDLPTGGSSDDTGGGAPFDTYQPSLALNYIIATEGLFPGIGCCGSVNPDSPVLGEVIAFTGDFAPRGWALANGQLLQISQNTALFSILGTQFGGNGQTTFALPDLRGRAIVGWNANFSVGEQLGSTFTTLTEDNLARHTHAYDLAATPGVPEPASWAMMIAGLGLAGAVLRRRATAVRFA